MQSKSEAKNVGSKCIQMSETAGKAVYDPQSFSLSSLTVYKVGKCMMPSVFKSILKAV